MDYFKKTKGAVSIFLVIILVPMMTVSALFVDASKISLAKSVAASAGDLTLNTALTDYDTVLKDMYGLFATAQNTDELYASLEDYYRTCIISSGVSKEDADSYVEQIMAQLGLVGDNRDTADILNMQLVDFDVRKRTDASLANATIFEKQIVEFMKYRAPINTGLGFLSSLKSFTTLSKQTELVDKRTEYYQEQESVMRNAQEAWKKINQYNKSKFVTDDNYFSTMQSNFSKYETNYQEIGKKIIRDLYDAQNYGSFSARLYSIDFSEVDVNGEKKTIPIFFTNKDKTSKLTPYNELSTYSDSNQATAENIKKAINEYYTAYNVVKTAQEQLMEFDANTYGQQYLIQTNRRGLYTTWTDGMKKLYEKYSVLRHAATYAGTTESGKSVMTTSEKMCGESSLHPYSYYYDKYLSDFDTIAAVFNKELPKYNSALQQYANAADTNTSGVSGTIAVLYGEVTGYRQTVYDASKALEGAITYLGYVLDGVKVGGTLEKKANEWETVAKSSELKNTSMSKQDLAEIDSLSTYLNEGDVKKLIDRLSNIKGHLDELLNQIDSYTYFGTKIVEISDYQTMCNILKNKIGDNELKRVPTNKSQLEEKIASWCNGQFVIGNKVNVSWENQSGTQAKLIKDKPNFYSYLYTHFNTGDVSTDTTERKEDEANGKNLYDNIKSKSSESASGNSSFPESQSGNQIKDKSNLPSKGKNGQETPSGTVSTGNTAAKDTSGSLSSMFTNLSKAVLDMGTDLRDKLYVSDYILSMFSYDTISKEYAKKNPGKDITLQTLTLNPIDTDHNFAYGAEVEYIIYGGDNQSNINKAYGSIYGIRLGFNLIYAFMDSEIRDGAFAIATPISAATLGVIPVPLIQGAIIIGIACCESAIDLTDIKSGESVPLFKTAETWHCSVKGLISEAKGVAGSLIKTGTNYVIDEGTRKLGEILDMTDEEINKYIQSGADDLTGYVEDAYDTLITRHANTAIQKLTTLANSALEEHALNGCNITEYISNGLDNWLAKEAAGTDTANDIGYIVKKEAVNIIKTQFISEIVSALQTAQSNIASEISSIGASLNDKIEEIRSVIVDKVNNGCEQVKDYKSKMIDSLKESMKDGAKSVKDTLNKQIDGIFGSSSEQGSDNTGIASLLSFSYSDYLRLFLMIGLYTNESGVILRTADVIQVNMSKQTGNENFALSNSAVYVDISATIQVKPTLLALPLFADVSGNPTSNERWYTITYKSTKGY